MTDNVVFDTHSPADRYQEFMKKPEVYGTWPWRYPIDSLEDQQVLLRRLQERGLSQDAVQAIAKDNFMRLFQAVLQ